MKSMTLSDFTREELSEGIPAQLKKDKGFAAKKVILVDDPKPSKNKIDFDNKARGLKDVK